MQLDRTLLEGALNKKAFYKGRRKGEGYWQPAPGRPGGPPAWSQLGRPEGVRTKGFGVSGDPSWKNVKRVGRYLRDEPLRRNAELESLLIRTPLVIDEG